MTSGLEAQLRAVSLRVTQPRLAVLAARARYESRTGDNHHPVLCRSCGVIADVDCAVGHAPCLNASDDHGFVVDEAEVVHRGTCPDCATHAVPNTFARSEGSS